MYSTANYKYQKYLDIEIPRLTDRGILRSYFCASWARPLPMVWRLFLCRATSPAPDEQKRKCKGMFLYMRLTSRFHFGRYRVTLLYIVS